MPSRYHAKMPNRRIMLVAVIALLLASPLHAQDAATAKPKVVKQNADGSIELLAIDSNVEGKRARIEKKGDNPHNIGYWTDPADTASWQFDLARPGTYDVEVEYSLDRRSEGSEYALEFGARKIDVKPKVTGTWLDFTRAKVGTAEFSSSGPVKLIVRPIRKPGQAVLDLRAVRLTPVK